MVSDCENSIDSYDLPHRGQIFNLWEHASTDRRKQTIERPKITARLIRTWTISRIPRDSAVLSLSSSPKTNQNGQNHTQQQHSIGFDSRSTISADCLADNAENKKYNCGCILPATEPDDFIRARMSQGYLKLF